MALIRGHHNFDDHFTQIPNDWVRDNRLTLEARGLLAQIMSHKPGWNMSIKSIALQNGVGRDKVRRIFDELMSNGYLVRSETQTHNEKGHLSGFDYITSDPGGVTQKPSKAEPSKAEPTKAARPPKNTKPKNTNTKNTNNKNRDFLDEAFTTFWSIYPKKADKPAARRAFEKALKRTTLEVIVDGATKYRDDPNRQDAYTKNGSTWLNNDAWENDPIPAPVSKAVSIAEQNKRVLSKYLDEGGK
jgi:hypothetical protein